MAGQPRHAGDVLRGRALLTRIEDVSAPDLEDASVGDQDLAATQTSAVAADFIYATGYEVLPIGGFTGTIPSPTLGQLQADIRNRRFRTVIAFSTHDPPADLDRAALRTGPGPGVQLQPGRRQSDPGDHLSDPAR